MKKLILLGFLLVVLILTGCSLDKGKSDNELQPTSNAWVYLFANWDNESYVVGVYEEDEEEVKEEKIGAEIGEVTSYSNQENSDQSGNFSNKYEVGTKYYEITDINPKEAIAIKVQEGKFIKAVISDIWLEENL